MTGQCTPLLKPRSPHSPARSKNMSDQKNQQDPYATMEERHELAARLRSHADDTQVEPESSYLWRIADILENA
jgi:hypothetical protein